ncbi:hypothetical protein AAFF_G00394580 [Aldrovandia affinis]|uniref:Uncharacterized protein n=1 Tax=Aldrovandia affinis TaxID=143900 RepID=A0AAD7SDS3_9TELE|nr:hypothetical protein AAFF_G00394580 [Aldrovandia affinis]
MCFSPSGIPGASAHGQEAVRRSIDGRKKVSVLSVGRRLFVCELAVREGDAERGRGREGRSSGPCGRDEVGRREETSPERSADRFNRPEPDWAPVRCLSLIGRFVVRSPRPFKLWAEFKVDS